MKVVIKENTWLTRGMFDFGWGNGYVLIPENNPLHGKHYNDIDVDVHGGLTFSELVDAEMVERWKLDEEDEGKWCVGFDTAHCDDNLSKWPKEKVQEEAERLKEQLLSYEMKNIYFKSIGGYVAYKNMPDGKSIMVADWGKQYGYEISVRNRQQGKDEHYSPCTKEEFDTLFNSAIKGLINLNQ